ncbi:hypothetical protein LCGC14_1518240, partial [marine sediment metagenome]
SFYVDGVGFSWDSDYDVGDNINSHGKAVITALEDEGWTFESLFPYVSVGISGEYNSHKKILNITDNSNVGYTYLVDYFAGQTSGSIEYYIKVTDNSDYYGQVQLRYDGGYKGIVYIRSGNWKWYTGAVVIDTGVSANVDEWYHIRIDFDIPGNDVDIYINGGNHLDTSFNAPPVEINNIRIITSDTGIGYSIYFDAITYSWDEPTSYFAGSYNQHANIEAVIDFVVDIPFDYYERDILRLIAESRHFTNILANVSFSLYNFNSSSWVEINNSQSTSETSYSYNETDIINGLNKYVDSSGNVRFRYYGFNNSAFSLLIDLLNITIYFPQTFEYTHTLNLLGTWKYRFSLDTEDLSEYNTTWIYFNVILPIDNFEAISESEYATRWILTSSSTSPVMDFSDDISGVNWDLSGVADRIIDTDDIPTDDSYVFSVLPDTNAGSEGGLHVTDERWIYIKYVYPYLDLNVTSNSSFYAYTVGSGMPNDQLVYNTSDFDESTLTWNNKPALDTIQNVVVTTNIGYELHDIGYPSYYYTFTPDTADGDTQVWYSSETVGTDPYIRHHFSKSYVGGGYFYMQTNETEILSFKSTDYGVTYNLSSGDYFTVDIQTTSTNEINLVLLNDGVQQGSYIVSQSGNTNFQRRFVDVVISSDVVYDQIMFSGTFEDAKYLKVWDIKSYQYTLTGDFADFYVDPDGSKSIFLQADTYVLRIFEDGLEKVGDVIVLTYDDLYQYIYYTIETIESRVVLFTVDGINLPFTDFHVNLTRTLNNNTNSDWMVDDIFNIDVGSSYIIEVYDAFNSSVNILYNGGTGGAKTYVDLYLEIYSLQIKNLQTKKTIIDINTTHIYPLLSGDSVYFILVKDYYQIGYNDTNGVYKQFLIYLDSNQAYELNRSKIVFLAFVNQKGEHLFFGDYKTYINGSLIYENIFYREIGDIIGIEVKDLYDISIRNQTYTVVLGDNYIPVVLTLYSLKVMNQQEVFNHINITRDPVHYTSDYYWSEWVAPNEIIEFKLFAGYYKINLTDNEGSSYSFYEYTLSGDDVLLISSDSTLAQVIYNIANVNTTLGNQITNVEINITNQNSDINNTIINIDINLSNVNSTLGTLLTNIGVSITSVNTTIVNQLTALGVNITNINSSIYNQILTLSVDLTNVNTTIVNQLTALGVNITNINTTIVNQLTTIGVNITNMNSTIVSQILTVIADISNINTTIISQITTLGVNITNINTTIVNQITALG